MIMHGIAANKQLKVPQPINGLDTEGWRSGPCTKQETNQLVLAEGKGNGDGDDESWEIWIMASGPSTKAGPTTSPNFFF